MATTAAAPITSANSVAHAAVVSERWRAPIGSMPICRPGRISVPSSDRHAAVEYPSPTRNERSTSATSGSHDHERGAERPWRRRASVGGHAGGAARRARALDRVRVPALRPRRPTDRHREDAQLQHGERRCPTDVAELRRAPPHLDLDRRVPTPPSTLITPNDVNVNRNTIAAAATIAGRISGRVTRPERAPRPGAERGRGVLEVVRQLRPTGTDGAHDHGEVEHDVGGDDRPHAAIERVGEQRHERGADDDRRQHEHRRQRSGQQPPAGEGVARDRPCREHPEHERRRRADHRLPHREPDDAPRGVGAQRVGDGVDPHTVGEQRRERPGVEDEQEDDRRRRRGRRRTSAAGCSGRAGHDTISVQRSIQSSRLASITAGSSVSGSVGMVANCTNAGSSVTSG